MSTIISVENVSKCYRLGTIGGGTLRDDFARWWAKIQKKPDPTAKVEPHNIRHAGQDFWALRDVSFEIRDGDILGVIGRNGAGKSTLLKILSRVTAPTSGLVKFKGRIASLLEVGTGFHPELTGRENIFLNGAILGMTKVEIRKKLDEIIAFSEIEEFIDTPVKRYSSGMYVRLAFAVAAHLEPEILIVDEVLAVGDTQFQKKCIGKMGDVSRSGRTVLFVSHNFDAIRNLCTSAILLQKGHLAFSGSVDTAIEKYLSPETSHVAVRTFDKVSKKPFFRDARIMDHSGTSSTTIDVRYGFSIELTYEIPEPIKNLEVAIRVHTDDARPVFTSLMSEALPEVVESSQRGPRKAVVTVPGNFLMPGDYFVTIALHESIGQVFDFHEEAFNFTIEDTGTIFTKYHHNHMIGVVIHPLAWACTGST